jgi:peptidyl-prolyl cis-trans isomerase B (cyclophilin B)
MKKIIKISIVLCFILIFCSCNKDKNNIVEIDVKDYGKIVIELYPNIAPRTVNNFKKLVKEGYYDGLIFHRVINEFMIQTGDPTGTGLGGSEKTIKGEFELNGFKNTLSHTRGVVSMARKGSNPETYQTLNSASSQFFIVQADSTFLDGKYAAFGKVKSGLDIVDKIAAVETDSDDKPIEDIVINSIKFKEGE